MWLRFWKLAYDPFLGPDRVFVSTGSHDEALARLHASIDSAEPRAVLRGTSGVGKTVTLLRLARELRGLRRRVSLVSSPADGLALLSGLAKGLGRRVPPGAPRGVAWSTLDDAVRVCQWQKLHPILIVDDSADLTDERDHRDIERLAHLGTRPGSPLTVIHAVDDDDLTPPRPWELTVRIVALTRSETERYVAAKLAAAGRHGPAFTPAALSRVHHLSGGIPRGIDRLASLALIGGAARGVGHIDPELVDGVAGECLTLVA